MLIKLKIKCFYRFYKVWSVIKVMYCKVYWIKFNCMGKYIVYDCSYVILIIIFGKKIIL